MFRKAEGKTRSRPQCSWCEDVNLPNDVTFFNAKQAGPAGRNGDTRRLREAPRPPLSPREEDRLFAAEEAVFELTQQIEEMEAVAEPTAAQTASLEDLRERLEDEQGTVDRLQRKRDRRG